MEPAQDHVLLIEGNSVSLTVVVSIDRSLLPALQDAHDLSWYHNGVKIFPDSSHMFLQDNMTLTMSPANSMDVGIYEAVYDGISVYPFNQACETEVLRIVRLYPIMSPATFIVYSSGMHVQIICNFEKVCMYACMHVNVCRNASIQVGMHACMYFCIYTCMYTYVYQHI